MRLSQTLPIVILASLLLAVVQGATRDWPDWLNAAANLPTPANTTNAPAVVLLDDTTLEVDSKGIATEVHRAAIRILHISGRSSAWGGVSYNDSADRILASDAWLIRSGKLLRPVKKSDWVDIATNSPGAVIDEYRSKQINFSNEALAGDVFGYETRTRRPLLVAQFFWSFGSSLPIITERVSVRLPAGFSLNQKVSGSNPPAFATNGNTWTWTSSDRPYRPSEPWTDPLARVDANVLISFRPPANATGTGAFPQSFTSWPEVSALYDSLNRGQCDSSPELIAKALALTANCTDSLGKIRSLAAFVQKIRYIEINQGLRYGFGWKARKASAVFSNGYGDCKDKANLLTAMLREAGIRAHRVIARIDSEHGFIAHNDFPSPVQFNHAIVGIEVDGSVQLPSVVETGTMGRLLFFDPTDPYTLVGDLPYSLQGTNVHVSTPESTTLITLPEFKAQNDFLIERNVTLTLSSGSNLTAVGRISATGQTGARLRHEFTQANQPKEIEQFVTSQLSDAFRGAVVQEKTTEDDLLLGRCTLSFTCQHPRFVQRLTGNATMVKLDVLSRRHLPNFSENERRLPIELPPLVIKDEIVLKLTGGYVFDELPGNISLESPYGHYEASFSLEHDSLVMKRTILLRHSRIPVEDYPKVRRFLSDMSRADRSSVLLKPGA